MLFNEPAISVSLSKMLKKARFDAVSNTRFTLGMVAAGVVMRGPDEASGSLFSYVDLKERAPEWHPLRLIRLVLPPFHRTLG